MINTGTDYIVYLKSLKKNELNEMFKDYNQLRGIFDCNSIDCPKGTKVDLENILEEEKKSYFKYLIMCLDNHDFACLKMILSKKVNDEFLSQNKEIVNYLISKRLLWQKDNLEVPEDVLEIVKELIKSKEVINYIEKSDSLYSFSQGLIVAYGVVTSNYYESRIVSVFDYQESMKKLSFYYKKDYIIDDNKIVSNKLSNKKRIANYLKNENYKYFSNQELLALGHHTYHHRLKSYKKFIKMLKNNYVFKNKDIMFIDRNIIIPYLYTSLNEEEVARNNLEKTISESFEFKGEKLKAKMLDEIIKIRNVFPLWEYRGYTKIEVEK